MNRYTFTYAGNDPMTYCTECNPTQNPYRGDCWEGTNPERFLERHDQMHEWRENRRRELEAIGEDPADHGFAPRGQES